jgi:hypothetical protein
MGIYWQKWVRSCTAGIGLGTGLALLLVSLVEINGTYNFSKGWQQTLLIFGIYLGAGILQGVFIGLPQINKLRLRYTRIQVRNWILNTILVCIIIWLGIGLIRLLISDIYQQVMKLNELYQLLLGIASGFMVGLLLGIFQYATIRKYAIHAYRWIIANIVAGIFSGLILSIPLVLHLYEFSRPISIFTIVVSLGVMGFTFSSITGYYLVERLSPKLS